MGDLEGFDHVVRGQRDARSREDAERSAEEAAASQRATEERATAELSRRARDMLVGAGHPPDWAFFEVTSTVQRGLFGRRVRLDFIPKAEGWEIKRTVGGTGEEWSERPMVSITLLTTSGDLVDANDVQTIEASAPLSTSHPATQLARTNWLHQLVEARRTGQGGEEVQVQIVRLLMDKGLVD